MKSCDELQAEAMHLHSLGYNCAQCVLMAYAGELDINLEQAAALASGLGAGMACGEICGVANALAIALGIASHQVGPEGKKRVMPKVARICAEFSSPFGGKISCRQLKGKCGVSCDDLISRGISLLHDALNDRKLLKRTSDGPEAEFQSPEIR